MAVRVTARVVVHTPPVSRVDPMPEYVLSGEDRRKLIQLLRDVDKLKSDVRGKGYQDLELNDQLPPEVYVALTPVGGIPALTQEDTTGTGTGSGTDIGYRNSPGYADCDVYRLLWDGSVPNMYPTGIVRRVYNLNGISLAGNVWVLIHRDKYGQWYVPTLGFELAECP